MLDLLRGNIKTVKISAPASYSNGRPASASVASGGVNSVNPVSTDEVAVSVEVVGNNTASAAVQNGTANHAGKVEKELTGLETDDEMADGKIDPDRHRFPYCIVWTPIPFLT